MEMLQNEMNKLELLQADAQAKRSGAESKLRWSDFTTRVARKAMVIGLVLATLNQLCGCFAMINYTAQIFQESGSDLSPNASAIVIGIIQLFGAYVSTILVDRAGRKVSSIESNWNSKQKLKFNFDFSIAVSYCHIGGRNQFGFGMSRHLLVPEIHWLPCRIIWMDSNSLFLVRHIFCMLGRSHSTVPGHVGNSTRKGTFTSSLCLPMKHVN